MISTKRQRVNDDIVARKSIKIIDSGVVEPGEDQEDFDLGFETTLVKTTYILRLKMARNTDHYPVYSVFENTPNQK